MSYWKIPTDEHIVYEALSAIADGRVELGTNTAKCFSTSRNKFYTIDFNTHNLEFMSDDNMAYYKTEVSYPMVAVLLLTEKIQFNKNILPYFKNIPWKDINQKNKNDYMKSVREFLQTIPTETVREEIRKECLQMFNEANKLSLKLLGNKKLPSKAY